MSLHVTIATVSDTLFDGTADSVLVPGTGGEMGILANHEPLITTLKSGVVTVTVGKEKFTFPVTQGVLEVSNSVASILI
ncbi:MAG: hypothetical protein WAX38_04820 [Minisyncoccia bacterium]